MTKSDGSRVFTDPPHQNGEEKKRSRVCVILGKGGIKRPNKLGRGEITELLLNADRRYGLFRRAQKNVSQIKQSPESKKRNLLCGVGHKTSKKVKMKR